MTSRPVDKISSFLCFGSVHCSLVGEFMSLFLHYLCLWDFACISFPGCFSRTHQLNSAIKMLQLPFQTLACEPKVCCGLGATVVHWIALLPHSSKDPGSNSREKTPGGSLWFFWFPSTIQSKTYRLGCWMGEGCFNRVFSKLAQCLVNLLCINTGKFT